nr:hypothetical protein CFP56_25991 [Quercus suber]
MSGLQSFLVAKDSLRSLTRIPAIDESGYSTLAHSAQIDQHWPLRDEGIFLSIRVFQVRLGHPCVATSSLRNDVKKLQGAAGWRPDQP